MTLHIPTTPPDHLSECWCLFDGTSIYLANLQLPEKPVTPCTRIRYIGHNGSINLWAGEVIGTPPADWQLVSLRQAINTLPDSLTALLSRAAQLHRFDRSHQFCGACATPTLANPHDSGRHCPACKELYYPRLSPAMMVLIHDQDRILLARSPHFAPGMYSALAGFVEPGETLEACVHREAYEEVGIHIRDLKYIQSQSWPFPHSLMLAFTAAYDGGDITPQPGEIEHAAWFPLHALPAIPGERSIAHALIQWHIRHHAD